MTMMAYRISLSVIVISICVGYASPKPTYYLRILDDTSVIKCCDQPRKDLELYCYVGQPKVIFRAWETVMLQISLNPDEYERFDGENIDDVLNKYTTQSTSWTVNLFSNRKKYLKLNPFNSTCIGIKAQKDYDLKLVRIRFDIWRIIIFASGLFLFFAAPKLCSNSLFYYLTGVSVGVMASILILIYMLSRFLPKKPLTYGFLAGGWTVGLYIGQLVWENIRTVVIEYKTYVLYYALTTGIISFVICYRMGPVSDPRSINLIKWALQVFSLGLMFISTDYQEAGVAAVILVVSLSLVPYRRVMSTFFRVKKWFVPYKVELLTEEEYHEQATVETRKALESLRGYCSSPECNQWRTVLRLKDPLRFAKFMEGESHLSDEEMLSFEFDLSRPPDDETMISSDSD